MAPPHSPTSPTSLLSAHQLKREHGFLLIRMQRLEAIAGIDSRNETIETNATRPFRRTLRDHRDERYEAIEPNATRPSRCRLTDHRDERYQAQSCCAQQVRTLKHGGKNEAEEDRKEVMSRLETISSEMEAIAKQIAIIEDREWQTDENWERWKSWARRWMLLRPALEKPGKEMDHAGEAGQADGRCSDRLGRFWLR
ncbi:unnamed protein product [Zymoseptoria tritici ST99CH_3D1]|nr:unnamed protein product [Zymoseptoria tritici ST99CH_3D1]